MDKTFGGQVTAAQIKEERRMRYRKKRRLICLPLIGFSVYFIITQGITPESISSLQFILVLLCLLIVARINLDLIDINPIEEEVMEWSIGCINYTDFLLRQYVISGSNKLVVGSKYNDYQILTASVGERMRMCEEEFPLFALNHLPKKKISGTNIEVLYQWNVEGLLKFKDYYRTLGI